jgi:ATP-binding cassette, subfamily A (ABC1), member 3
MDEADLLGDRIAIMGDGKLRCCGSSLFLKRYYGVGYNMTIEKKNVSTFKSAAVARLVRQHIPEAKMLTDVGAELTFQLDFKSSHLFQALFEAFDVQQDELGVESYGVSVTTLEEVFIKTARGTDTLARAEEGRQKGRIDPSAIKVEVPAGNDESKPDQESSISKDAVAPAVSTSLGDSDADKNADLNAQEDGNATDTKLSAEIRAVSFDRVREDAKWYMFTRHVTAMVMKRYLTFWRDQKTWVIQFIVPALFVLTGVLILLFVLDEPNQPSLELSATMYNAGIDNNHLPLPYADATQMCFPCNAQFGCVSQFCRSIPLGTQDNVMNALPLDGFSSYPSLSIEGADQIVNVSRALLDGFNDFEASVFGAVSMYSNETYYSGYLLDNAPFVGQVFEYVIHANYTAVFGAPLFNVLVAQGIVRTIDPTVTITTHYHPMPLTANQGTFSDSIELSTAFMFLTLALAIIPASFAMNVVREREVNTKSQQMLSGVSLSAYWISTQLWYV